jgi:short-subunit dehydrogenase
VTSDHRRTVALVTGASTGIGRELARLLAQDGINLVLVARSVDLLEALARELQHAHGVEVMTIAGDLSDPDTPSRVFERIRDRGLTIDTLVNNAGVGIYGEFSNTNLDDELRMISLNTSALVALTKHCLVDMRARNRGRILQVASTAAFVPGPKMAVYYATKAFVLSFSEALRDELRGTAIIVSVLCAGPTATEFHRRAGAERSKLFAGVVMDPAVVAATAYEGLRAGKAIIVPGLRNKVVPLVARCLPRRMVLWLSRRASDATHR